MIYQQVMRQLLIHLLLFTSTNIVAQYIPTHQLPAEQKGLYFSKKSYIPATLPNYDSIKHLIPAPVLEQNNEWTQMYWFCWKTAFNKMKQPKDGSPFVSNYIDEAFSKYIYQWDTHFMIMFWKYVHHIFPSIQSHDNFYRCQHPSGYICREIDEATGADAVWISMDNTINPPLYPWVEYDYYRISGDDSRFNIILPPLEKYAQWLDTDRKKIGTKHNLYWQTNLGSGMDNSPRTGSGWVDISAQLVMFYKDIARIAKHIGDEKRAAAFAAKADSIGKRINQFMWNEEQGLYFDVDDEGKQIPVKTIACFWPLMAGLCNPSQAEKLKKHLMNEKEFFTLIPFPTLSKDHPAYHPRGDYWLGGVWAPTNYMSIKGLENYGFIDEARKASEVYLSGMYEVYRQTQTVWENYSPDSLLRGNQSKKDFVGWTGLGPIALLIENVIGIHTDGLSKTIYWDIHRTDRHGIEKLRLRDATVTLICNRRNTLTEPCIISVECDKPVDVIVTINNRKITKHCNSGKTVITNH